MVHGDDFVSAGSREATKRFQNQLAAIFEIKTQIIGAGDSVQHARVCTEDIMPNPTGKPDQSVQRARLLSVREGDPIDIQEGRVLTRIIRWTNVGWVLNTPK